MTRAWKQAGWEKAGFDDSKWESAVVGDAPSIALSSQMTAPAQSDRHLDAQEQ